MRKSLLIFRHIDIFQLLIADCCHTETLFYNNTLLLYQSSAESTFKVILMLSTQAFFKETFKIVILNIYYTATIEIGL